MRALPAAGYSANLYGATEQINQRRHETFSLWPANGETLRIRRRYKILLEEIIDRVLMLAAAFSG